MRTQGLGDFPQAKTHANTATRRPRLLGRRRIERLDHFVRDVILGIDVDRLVKNEVVFFLLGDLLDDLVHTVTHLRQLFALARVQVFLEFTALALEITVLVHQLALAGGPRIAVLDELTTGLDPQARRDTWELIEDIRDRGVTVVLVSHFMEEAERLCDRVALIDKGRVVELDTPAALAGRVAVAQRIQFRPSSPVDDALLTDLPEVSSIVRKGDVVVVTGTGNVVNAVISVLARNQIVAQQLRVDQANLEDAYLELTREHAARPAGQGE